MSSDVEMFTQELVPRCVLCGSARSELLCPVTRDRLHGLPGRFSLVRCLDCALVRLSPRPCAASLSRYYPSDYYAYKPCVGFDAPERPLGKLRETLRLAVIAASHGYDRSELPGWAAWVPRRLPVWLRHRARYGLKGFPDAVPNGRALDIGCGNGWFLSRIARLGWEVEGVDISPEAAAIASEEYGVRVHVGALEELSIEDNSFDFIRMSHVIEHLFEPTQTLHRVASLLRPGGRLYIETPNIDSLAFRHTGSYWYQIDSPRHLWLFSPTTLAHALDQCGLSVSRMGACAVTSFPWEETYRREERAGYRFPNRPQLPATQLPRMLAIRTLTRTVARYAPGLGDTIACWAQRPPVDQA